MGAIFPTATRIAEVMVEERGRAAQPPREPDSASDCSLDAQGGLLCAVRSLVASLLAPKRPVEPQEAPARADNGRRATVGTA